jgi:hypothetical protein
MNSGMTARDVVELEARGGVQLDFGLLGKTALSVLKNIAKGLIKRDGELSDQELKDALTKAFALEGRDPSEAISRRELEARGGVQLDFGLLGKTALSVLKNIAKGLIKRDGEFSDQELEDALAKAFALKGRELDELD